MPGTLVPNLCNFRPGPLGVGLSSLPCPPQKSCQSETPMGPKALGLSTLARYGLILILILIGAGKC